MLNISSELRTLLKQDYLPYHAPVAKQLVLYFAELDLTITDADFTDGDSFSLEDSLCGDELSIGSCVSACMKFNVENITQNITDKVFTAKFVIEDTDIKLGTFVVSEAKKSDDDTYKAVVAYDLMSKFDIDVLSWYDALTFPISLKAFRNSLCTYCGVPYEDSNLPNDAMNVEKTISTNLLNGREVLVKCEELNGCFGHMNRDGKLDHIILSQSNPVETLTNVSYDTLKFEEYTTDTINKVQIRTVDGDVGAYVGTGTNCYSISANYLAYGKTAETLSTICTNLSTNILGITYRPYECDMQGLPYLDIGDLVTFSGNESVNSYIMQRTLSGTQVLADKATAKGSKTLSEDNNVNTQMEQIKGKTNVLTRNVEQMESTITEFDKQINVLLPGEWYPDATLHPCLNNMTNLEYEINSKINQTAKEITTEVNNVSDQLSSQISQTATSITAQVTNLSTNMNAQFAITESEISTKVEKDGIISSINQSAESITINASKINLQGYVTYTGLSEGTTVIDGGCIKTGQIDAERIKAGTMTGMTLDGCYVNCFSCRSESSSSTYSELSTGVIWVNTNNHLTTITGSSIFINGYSVLTTGNATTDNIWAYLHDSSTYTGTSYITFDNTSGDTNVPTIGWVKARASSDKRLKKNVKHLVSVEENYMKLDPVSYKFKKYVNDDNTHYGFLAQDVLKLFPDSDLVEYDTDVMTKGERNYIKDGGVYRLNYDNMHALHVAMIQKQQQEIIALRGELNKCQESIQKYLN